MKHARSVGDKSQPPDKRPRTGGNCKRCITRLQFENARLRAEVARLQFAARGEQPRSGGSYKRCITRLQLENVRLRAVNAEPKRSE